MVGGIDHHQQSNTQAAARLGQGGAIFAK